MVTGDKNQKFSANFLFATFLDRLAGDAKPGDLNFIKRANNFQFHTSLTIKTGNSWLIKYSAGGFLPIFRDNLEIA